MKRFTEEQWRKETNPPQDALLVKAVETEISEGEEGSRTLNFVISTEDVDSYNDIISADGWDLERFEKNPVVLFAHNRWSPPVGKAVAISAKDGKLRATAEFASKDVYPFADTVYQLLKGGFLSATSVGFRPQEWTYDEDRGGINFLKSELLEFSIVPIPANPEALIENAMDADIDLEPLRDWAEKTLEVWAPENHVHMWVPEANVDAVKTHLEDPQSKFWVSPEIVNGGTAAGTNDGTGERIITTTDTVTLGENGDPVTPTIPDIPIEVKVDPKLEALVVRLENLLAAMDQMIAGEVDDPVDVEVEEEVKVNAKDDEDCLSLDVIDFSEAEAEEEEDVELDVDKDALHDVVAGALEKMIMKRTGRLPKEV